MGRIAPDLFLDARIGDFAELHIDPIELNDMVETYGVGCEYRKAVQCPCKRRETRMARMGCSICNGLRFVYPENLREPMVALVLNRMPRRQHATAGELVTGTVVITFPLGVRPALGDMILPTGETHTIHEHLWRGGQQIDNRRMRGRARTDDVHPEKQVAGPEKVLYPEICQIDAIHWIVDEGTPDARLATASAVDYELVGNEIRWTDGHGPDIGHGYAIRYEAPAAYILNPGEPLYRREATPAFPYRVEGERLDRWGEPSLRGDV